MGIFVVWFPASSRILVGLGVLSTELRGSIRKQRGICEIIPRFIWDCSGIGLLRLDQIRIDAAGNRTYTQFDAVPHPPMKPMAYVQGGLSSLFMM